MSVSSHVGLCVCVYFLDYCDQDFIQSDKSTRLLVSKRLQVIFVLFNEKKMYLAVEFYALYM